MIGLLRTEGYSAVQMRWILPQHVQTWASCPTIAHIDTGFMVNRKVSVSVVIPTFLFALWMWIIFSRHQEAELTIQIIFSYSVLDATGVRVKKQWLNGELRSEIQTKSKRR